MSTGRGSTITNHEYLNMIRGTKFSNLFRSVNLFSTAKTGRNPTKPTSLSDRGKQNNPPEPPSNSSGRRRKRHYTKKSDIPKYTDTETSSTTPSATPSTPCSSGESNQQWKPDPDGGAPEQDDGEDDLGDFFPPVFPELSKRRLRCCILALILVSIWAVWEHYFRSRFWPSPPWGR